MLCSYECCGKSLAAGLVSPIEKHDPDVLRAIDAEHPTSSTHGDHIAQPSMDFKARAGLLLWRCQQKGMTLMCCVLQIVNILPAV